MTLAAAPLGERIPAVASGRKQIMLFYCQTNNHISWRQSAPTVDGVIKP
jgi:hypothetical protein